MLHEHSHKTAHVVCRLDSYGTGHIRVENFYQIMSSSDLALPLDQEEILYVGGKNNPIMIIIKIDSNNNNNS